ncbi:MAG TPA: S26 family signal peptidase [Phycisphaerales bacterium]|nr:S26 family signal peptidase [Phycisphaerales bacterium]
MASDSAQPTTIAAAKTRTSVKETITSIVIAFALAFVFRGFVVEAFVIPTGSMAPTLNGAHVRARSPLTGYEFAVGPRDYTNPSMQVPLPMQGTTVKPLQLTDPMSAAELRLAGAATRWGDRIFVLKYLAGIYDPARFDVVVFKNPTDPTINFIKRLVGLPGEMVALADGDVFTRTPQQNDASGGNPWALAGWKCRTKPAHAQRAMWQPVFDGSYAPLPSDNSAVFTPPWKPATDTESSRWRLNPTGEYQYAGPGPAALRWDGAPFRVTDEYPYNQSMRPTLLFPVSDVRMSLGLRPSKDGMPISAVLFARKHEFRLDIDGQTVSLRMRSTETPDASWQELGGGGLDAPMPAGVVTNVEFWHVDQTLQCWINDKLITSGVYDWTPADRVKYATRPSFEDIAQRPTSLIDGGIYTRPEMRWEFGGGDFTVYRVRLDRDIHYQANTYPQAPNMPALSTHPSATLTLGSNEYFCCGDNSPSSLDGRLWSDVHPWVETINPTPGVVSRDLMIGKAFFVYFPSPVKRWMVPVPDVGHMRWIW